MKQSSQLGLQRQGQSRLPPWRFLWDCGATQRHTQEKTEKGGIGHLADSDFIASIQTVYADMYEDNINKCNSFIVEQ